MEMKRFWRAFGAFARRFVVIYGFTMLATLVFMALFSRDAYVNWQYFLWCVLFSLAADLPSLVFVSARELTEAQWQRRFVFSILLTVAILMPLGYGRMWTGLGGAGLFLAAILAVTVGVHAVGFGMDTHTAHLVNEQIRKRHLEQKNQQNDEKN